MDEEERIIRLEVAESVRDIRFFEKVYVRFFQGISAFVRKRVEDDQNAQDVTQHTFVQAMLNIRQYSPRANIPFSSWLYRIAWNEVNRYYRDKKKEPALVVEESFIHPLLDEIGWFEKEKKVERLEKCLGNLPAKDRFIIELRFFEKKDFREIGGILQIQESAAKMRCHRIIQQLKGKMI